jgi:hypothetical protein
MMLMSLTSISLKPETFARSFGKPPNSAGFGLKQLLIHLVSSLDSATSYNTDASTKLYLSSLSQSLLRCFASIEREK